MGEHKGGRTQAGHAGGPHERGLPAPCALRVLRTGGAALLGARVHGFAHERAGCTSSRNWAQEPRLRRLAWASEEPRSVPHTMRAARLILVLLAAALATADKPAPLDVRVGVLGTEFGAFDGLGPDGKPQGFEVSFRDVGNRARRACGIGVLGAGEGGGGCRRRPREHRSQLPPAPLAQIDLKNALCEAASLNCTQGAACGPRSAGGRDARRAWAAIAGLLPRAPAARSLAHSHPAAHPLLVCHRLPYWAPAAVVLTSYDERLTPTPAAQPPPAAAAAPPPPRRCAGSWRSW